MKKVTSEQKIKKKMHHKRDTFKFADCISMMDVMKMDKPSMGFFMFMLDKVMEVREREIARYER